MKVELVNGKKRYIMKEWLATKIIFWLAQLFCFITAIFFTVKFGKGQISNWQLLHDVGLCFAACTLLCVPLFVKKIFKWYLPNPIILSAFFMVLANIIFGEVLHFFNDTYRLYDKILHTFNGGLFMFFGLSLLGMLNRMPEKNMSLAPWFCVVFAFGFAMLIEYFWEIYEFIFDSLTSSVNMQRWKDAIVGVTENGNYIVDSRRGSAIIDTMQDMIVHVFGALPVCIYMILKMNKEKCDFIVRTSILSKKQINFITLLNSSAKQLESMELTNLETSADNAFKECAAAKDEYENENDVKTP